MLKAKFISLLTKVSRVSQKPKQLLGMEKCFCWFTLIYGHVLPNFIKMNYEILIGRQFVE